MSALSVVVKAMPEGVPLEKVAMPLNCQSSKTAFTTEFAATLLNRGSFPKEVRDQLVRLIEGKLAVAPDPIILDRWAASDCHCR